MEVIVKENMSMELESSDSGPCAETAHEFVSSGCNLVYSSAIYSIKS